MAFINAVVRLLLLLLSFQFTLLFSSENKPIYFPNYVDEVSRIFIHKVQKEYGFFCEGTGGSMPTDIRSISVNFVANRYVTIDEARELFVNLTEKFREIIDHHDKIRPFLREYPFPPTRIEVGISFEPKAKPKNLSPIHYYIDYIFCVKGEIHYKSNDKITNRYFEVKKENYETALNIVRNSGK